MKTPQERAKELYQFIDKHWAYNESIMEKRVAYLKGREEERAEWEEKEKYFLEWIKKHTTTSLYDGIKLAIENCRKWKESRSNPHKKNKIMEAKELRIGNYVFDDENQICKISVLMSKQKMNFEGYDVNNFHRVEYDSDKVNIYISKVINPIPLTEEWLLKFGFIKYEVDFDSNEFYWCHRDLPFAIDSKSWNVQKTKAKVKFVHQLQNLFFVLTGNELTLKL